MSLGVHGDCSCLQHPRPDWLATTIDSNDTSAVLHVYPCLHREHGDENMRDDASSIAAAVAQSAAFEGAISPDFDGNRTTDRDMLYVMMTGR